MAHEHTHDHDHDHEHNRGPGDESQQSAPVIIEEDAAGKSLSDALRISFTILKVIMIVLVIAFFASGLKTVGSDERALVLQFGKIKGVGDEAVLGPGLHWVFPYPIEELVRIPVAKNISLAINTFWYKETRQDILGEGPRPRRYVPEKLDPFTEGYCLTGSQRNVSRPAGAAPIPVPNAANAAPPVGLEGEGSDYNIVHTRWQVNYEIAGVEQFFRNVYVRDIKPGEIYFDVMTEHVAPLLQSVVDDAIVGAMVHYTIDEALLSIDTIPRRVHQLVQEKLDEIESGLRVTSVQLVDVTWPKQVNDAFDAYIQASQKSQQAISVARTYAEETLTRTAGRMGELLYRALHGEKVDTEHLDALWVQAAGDTQDVIAQAQAYRTKVVEGAKANANYFTSILPGYREQPLLVARELYLATIREVLKNADEKFILDKSDCAGEQEFRIMVNRDPSLKPKNRQPAQRGY